MTKQTLSVGQVVTIKHDATPWYSGYGANPDYTIRAGDQGIVTHVDVIPVRGRKTYCVARFNDWQIGIQPEDVISAEEDS